MLRKRSEQPRTVTARDLKFKKAIVNIQRYFAQKTELCDQVFAILVERKPSIMHCAARVTTHCNTGGTFIEKEM